MSEHQQKLGAWGSGGDAHTPVSPESWQELDGYVADGVRGFPEGEDPFTLIVSGTHSGQISIQSHVYREIERFATGDEEKLFVVSNNRGSSMKVYQFQVGMFDPDYADCFVLDPPEHVSNITHDQHTLDLEKADAVYEVLPEGIEEYLTQVEYPLHFSLD